MYIEQLEIKIRSADDTRVWGTLPIVAKICLSHESGGDAHETRTAVIALVAVKHSTPRAKMLRWNRQGSMQGHFLSI